MDLPISTQKKPYILTLQPGKYSWCSCGLTQKEPFCDSSHKGTDFRSCKFELEEEKTVKMCGCKMTSTPPFCDGTHKTL